MSVFSSLEEGTGFGYQKTEESELLDLKRVDMVMEDVSRKDSFIEINDVIVINEFKGDISGVSDKVVSVATREEILNNPIFLKFITVDKNNNILDFLCLFKLDTCNTELKTKSRTGNIYCMFLEKYSNTLYLNESFFVCNQLNRDIVSN